MALHHRHITSQSEKWYSVKAFDEGTEPFQMIKLHPNKIFVLHLCKAKYLSTARAERKMGFANGTLKKLDRNVPSVNKIFVLADFFNVSADYLLGLSIQKQPSNLEQVKPLWDKLAVDQRNNVLGYMRGIIAYEQSEMKDQIRTETPLEKQRRAIRNQIDELQAEYSNLEKIRNKKGK